MRIILLYLRGAIGIIFILARRPDIPRSSPRGGPFPEAVVPRFRGDDRYYER